MNALDLLKIEHQKVEKIFVQFEQGGNSQQFQQLFEQLFQEISVHALIEEQIFYPEISRIDSIKEFVTSYYHEHSDLKASLAELVPMDNTQLEWGRKMTKLRNDYQRHIRDEETQLFPRIRQALTDQQLVDLGIKLDQAKISSLESPLVQLPVQNMENKYSTQEADLQGQQ